MLSRSLRRYKRTAVVNVKVCSRKVGKFMEDVKKIWGQLLEAAKPSLPPQTIEIWMQSCSPLRMEQNRLVLDTGNSYVEKRVRNDYLPVLERVMIEQKLGDGIDLTYDSTPVEPEHVSVPTPPVKPVISDNGLNRQYDFSSFVVGKSNRIAHAAGLAVAEAPGESYNPLFIWGGVGLGKTHLMHAIGNYALSRNPDLKVLYLSSEKFVNDLIKSIANQKRESFRSHYRNVDILLIDDIQFLAGKEATQEEFFHTFNDMYNEKKQIVLSSDRPPRELDGIDDRIRSRFAWGVAADIQPPDYETRIAILKKKAEQRRFPVNDDVINYLAETVPSNIRELEGALNRVIANSSFSQMPITVENTQIWLKDVIDTHHIKISSQIIIELVAKEFSYLPSDILGRSRTSEIALARQVAMYLCRKHTELSLQQIARDFGKKDHTTVLHAVRSIQVRINEDERVRSAVENIEKKL